ASYFTGDTADTPVPAPSLQGQAQSSTTPASVYSQAHLQSFTPSMPGVSSMAQTSSDTADVSITQAEYPGGAGLEEKWTQYQSAVKGIFRDVRGGALDNARQSLFTISNWLLSQVVDLGACECRGHQSTGRSY